MNAKALPWIFLAIVAGVYWLATPVSSDSTEPAPAETDQAVYGEFVPDASGGLYVIGVDALWYLRGSQLHQVAVADEILDVVPVADGTAYAIGFDSVWHLDGATARVVEKAPARGFTPLGAEAVDPAALFPLWQHERRRSGTLQDAAPLLGPDPREDSR